MKAISDLPRIRITIPQGERAFTRVFVNDEELRGVTRIWFDSGDYSRPFDPPGNRWREEPKVHIELIADVEFEGKARADLIESIRR